MNIIDAPQGSDLWLSIRARHFTASEAPAMLGLSKYKTRQELLREKATGLAEEVDANKQRLFDRGHEAEAAARPLAEELLQEDLFPATGSTEIDGLPLLASFDGLNMEETRVWENKLASVDVETMIDTGDAPLDQVRPTHVTQYLEKRSAETRHRALREVSILGMVYRFARAHDLTTADPVAPVRRGKLPGRKSVYIEDDVLQAVYEVACQPLKDAIDLAYVIGQRPGDVLALHEGAIKDGTLSLRQIKTGTPIRIAIDGALKEVLDRILARKRTYAVRSLALLVDERGQRMTKAKLRGRFEKARDQVPAAAHFQFRDLRAKAVTDMREASGIDKAKDLAGHSSVVMTEQYTRNRRGEIRSAIQKLPSKTQG